MIPVWVIALLAALGAVCLALPLHIGMTGVCQTVLRRARRHHSCKATRL